MGLGDPPGSCFSVGTTLLAQAEWSQQRLRTSVKVPEPGGGWADRPHWALVRGQGGGGPHVGRGLWEEGCSVGTGCRGQFRLSGRCL